MFRNFRAHTYRGVYSACAWPCWDPCLSRVPDFVLRFPKAEWFALSRKAPMKQVIWGTVVWQDLWCRLEHQLSPKLPGNRDWMALFSLCLFSIPTISWKRCATFKLHLLGCSPFPSQTIELCKWNLQPGQNQGWGFAPNCQGLVSITLGGIVSAMPAWVKSVSPAGISRLFPNVDVLQMPTWVSWPHICRMPCFLCCLHNKHLSSPRVLPCTGCSLP